MLDTQRLRRKGELRSRRQRGNALPPVLPGAFAQVGAFDGPLREDVIAEADRERFERRLRSRIESRPLLEEEPDAPRVEHEGVQTHEQAHAIARQPSRADFEQGPPIARQDLMGHARPDRAQRLRGTVGALPGEIVHLDPIRRHCGQHLLASVRQEDGA